MIEDISPEEAKARVDLAIEALKRNSLSVTCYAVGLTDDILQGIDPNDLEGILSVRFMALLKRAKEAQ